MHAVTWPSTSAAVPGLDHLATCRASQHLVSSVVGWLATHDSIEDNNVGVDLPYGSDDGSSDVDGNNDPADSRSRALRPSQQLLRGVGHLALAATCFVLKCFIKPLCEKCSVGRSTCRRSGDAA